MRVNRKTAGQVTALVGTRGASSVSEATRTAARVGRRSAPSADALGGYAEIVKCPSGEQSPRE
jgi:hypothetical protein